MNGINLTPAELALVRTAFREAFVRFPHYKVLFVIEEALKVLPEERRPKVYRGLVRMFKTEFKCARGGYGKAILRERAA